ncbi:PRC-barrel domain-containing protein [Rhodoblastus sp.]|uniref:PRC-barrel domain-containing protein n=1 Tax=Rhodoblastus sp. TaxID=1962975 RepID=UPI003F96C560
MLKLASALNGYCIKASDGEIGTIADFLFDDRTWATRWLVVDTGKWLTTRKVLLHPSAIGKVDHERRELPVALTLAQVQGSPELSEHEPVSMQMERHLYDYYGWEPMGIGSTFHSNPIASKYSAPPIFMFAPRTESGIHPIDCDPHLRSLEAITGYHVIGDDGAIGKVENLLVDDAGWSVPYLVIDAGNWWSGKHVLISRHAVKEISWVDREIRADVSRHQVKASPPWGALGDVDPDYEKDLHNHYDWPGHR